MTLRLGVRQAKLHIALSKASSAELSLVEEKELWVALVLRVFRASGSGFRI